jgi:hypothetical protein
MRTARAILVVNWEKAEEKIPSLGLGAKMTEPAIIRKRGTALDSPI